MKGIKLTLALLSLSVSFLGLLLIKTNFCEPSVFCYQFQTKSFALFYGGLAVSAASLGLLVVPRAFAAWKKFAIVALPLIALLFIFYPDPGAGDLFSPFPEQVYKWVSILFAAISLGIIGWVRFFKK